MQLWQIWVLVAILFFIAEIFTTGFFSATIGLALLGVAVAAALGFSLKIQLVVFSLSSLVAFFSLRPFFLLREEISPGFMWQRTRCPYMKVEAKASHPKSYPATPGPPSSY